MRWPSPLRRVSGGRHPLRIRRTGVGRPAFHHQDGRGPGAPHRPGAERGPGRDPGADAAAGRRVRLLPLSRHRCRRHADRLPAPEGRAGPGVLRPSVRTGPRRPDPAGAPGAGGRRRRGCAAGDAGRTGPSGADHRRRRPGDRGGVPGGRGWRNWWAGSATRPTGTDPLPARSGWAPPDRARERRTASPPPREGTPFGCPGGSALLLLPTRRLRCRQASARCCFGRGGEHLLGARGGLGGFLVTGDRECRSRRPGKPAARRTRSGAALPLAWRGEGRPPPIR